MSDFTPGPWKAETEYECAVYAHNNQMKIADIRGYGYLTGKGLGGIGLPDEEAKKIQDANARLIAAAPELFEAVFELLYYAREVCDNNGGESETRGRAPRIWKEIQEYETLLQRVRGKEETE